MAAQPLSAVSQCPKPIFLHKARGHTQLACNLLMAQAVQLRKHEYLAAPVWKRRKGVFHVPELITGYRLRVGAVVNIFEQQFRSAENLRSPGLNAAVIDGEVPSHAEQVSSAMLPIRNCGFHRSKLYKDVLRQVGRKFIVAGAPLEIEQNFVPHLGEQHLQFG